MSNNIRWGNLRRFVNTIGLEWVETPFNLFEETWGNTIPLKRLHREVCFNLLIFSHCSIASQEFLRRYNSAWIPLSRAFVDHKTISLKITLFDGAFQF